MKKLFCDRCGKDITGSKYYELDADEYKSGGLRISLSTRDSSRPMYMRYNNSTVCTKCGKSIKKQLKENIRSIMESVEEK